MRGKDIVPPLFRNLRRITPAYAGKSHFVTNFHLNRRDHPRVCGEKPIRAYVKIWNEGSPPRMRGKEKTNKKAWNSLRITPAYAGKSEEHAPAGVLHRDHPRVCGEKDHTYQQGLERMGSPPRMRGKVLEITAYPLCKGITPAYAGKSKPRRHGSLSAGDHPRVCGEKPKLCPLAFLRSGSPPRMRGKASTSP